MGKTDKLSRKLDWKVGVEKENQKLIKEQQICSLVDIDIIIEESEVDIIVKRR